MGTVALADRDMHLAEVVLATSEYWAVDRVHEAVAAFPSAQRTLAASVDDVQEQHGPDDLDDHERQDVREQDADAREDARGTTADRYRSCHRVS